MTRLTPSQEVERLAALIARKSAAHQSIAVEQYMLRMAKAKQLRAELRAKRRQAA